MRKVIIFTVSSVVVLLALSGIKKDAIAQYGTRQSCSTCYESTCNSYDDCKRSGRYCGTDCWNYGNQRQCSSGETCDSMGPCNSCTYTDTNCTPGCTDWSRCDPQAAGTACGTNGKCNGSGTCIEPTPTPALNCIPEQGAKCGGTVRCCAAPGVNACEAIPNRCVDTTKKETSCTDTSQCPACSVGSDCPQTPGSCNVVPSCNNGVCSCICSGTKPCGGGPNPTSTPTPTPTATPPTCDSITGNSPVAQNISNNYTITGAKTSADISSTILYARQTSPATGSWDIKSACSSASCTSSFTFPNAGTYLVAGNVVAGSAGLLPITEHDCQSSSDGV